MRVALVCDEFYPDLGGIAHYGYELALRFAANGLDFVVVTHMHDGQAEDEVVAGIRVRRVRGLVIKSANRVISPATFQRCHDFLLSERFDLIHGLTIYSPMAVMAVMFAQIQGLASVFTCHSIMENPLQILLHFPLFPVIAGTRRVIAVSNATASFCRRLRVPANRLVTVPNGVDTATFRIGLDGSAFRRELHLDSQPVIVTALRLAKRKGPGLLLDAFDEVLKLVPEARLVIAGDGAERGRLIQQIRDLGIGASVHMVGTLSKEQVAELMAAGDVFVLPSSLEAFGLAALEAAAAGTPVVCSNAGGIPEVFQDGVNALLYVPGDKSDMAKSIVRMIRDPDLRHRLSASAMTTARQLTWDTCAQHTLSLYEDSCRENASRSVRR